MTKRVRNSFESEFACVRSGEQNYRETKHTRLHYNEGEKHMNEVTYAQNRSIWLLFNFKFVCFFCELRFNTQIANQLMRNRIYNGRL